VFALLITAGCGSAPQPAASPSPSYVKLADLTDKQGHTLLAPQCLYASEGKPEVVNLKTGEGAKGVVLGPQSDGDICQWMPYARKLVKLGYHVAIYEWASPFKEIVTNAYDMLRKAGATSIALMGASQGAATSLAYAADMKPPAAGVVSLGGELNLNGEPVLTTTLIARFKGPLLLISTENDGYAPAADTRKLADAHPGAEQVLILSGSDHGVALLTDQHAPQVTTAIEAFLKGLK
jgi:dienelactone hydrolase